VPTVSGGTFIKVGIIIYYLLLLENYWLNKFTIQYNNTKQISTFFVAKSFLQKDQKGGN
jgi:hypothetical protein